jgi:hypothetical protein
MLRTYAPLLHSHDILNSGACHNISVGDEPEAGYLMVVRVPAPSPPGDGSLPSADPGENTCMVVRWPARLPRLAVAMHASSRVETTRDRCPPDRSPAAGNNLRTCEVATPRMGFLQEKQ